MMMETGWRRLWTIVTTALLALSISPAWSAEIADRAKQAEMLLGQGQSEAALSELEGAMDAFWAEAPLSFRAVLFARAGTVKGFGQYQPRGSLFSPREKATIYLEPVGYGFVEVGDYVLIRLGAGVEIRSPGGIVFAQAPHLGRLHWTGRAKSRELHGEISFALPDLKPGDYQMHVTLHDEPSGKEVTTILPFAIAPVGG